MQINTGFKTTVLIHTWCVHDQFYVYHPMFTFLLSLYFNRNHYLQANCLLI